MTPSHDNTERKKELFKIGGISYYAGDFVELKKPNDTPAWEVWIAELLGASDIYIEGQGLTTHALCLWCHQPATLFNSSPEINSLKKFWGTKELFLGVDHSDNNDIQTIARKVKVIPYEKYLLLNSPPPADTFYYRLKYSAINRKLVDSLPKPILSKGGPRGFENVPENPDLLYAKCSACQLLYDASVTGSSKSAPRLYPSQAPTAFLCPNCAPTTQRKERESVGHRGGFYGSVGQKRDAKRENLMKRITTGLQMGLDELKKRIAGEKQGEGEMEDDLTAEEIEKAKEVIEAVDPATFASTIESQLWTLHAYDASEWVSRARSVSFNICEPTNFSFRKRILFGEFSLNDFLSESVSSMAPASVQEKRRMNEEKYLREQVLLSETAVPIMRKTHKGEEFIISDASKKLLVTSDTGVTAMQSTVRHSDQNRPDDSHTPHVFQDDGALGSDNSDATDIDSGEENIIGAMPRKRNTDLLDSDVMTKKMRASSIPEDSVANSSLLSPNEQSSEKAVVVTMNSIESIEGDVMEEVDMNELTLTDGPTSSHEPCTILSINTTTVLSVPPQWQSDRKLTKIDLSFLQHYGLPTMMKTLRSFCQSANVEQNFENYFMKNCQALYDGWEKRISYYNERMQQ